MSAPTIVVIDDQAPFRRALRAVAAAAKCEVVGEAETFEEALGLLREIDEPDLVMIDINLGPTSGLDLTRELLAEDPSLRIVLVSTMARLDVPRDAQQTGALGYVEKSQLGPALVQTLASRTATASAAEAGW